jgi:cytochrome c biogenesis protein CcdA
MTTNRPSPEGAWDYEIPCNLEDQASISTSKLPPHAYHALAGNTLHLKKENIQMLKGWKTLLVAMGIAMVGAAQANGAAWAEVLGPANAGYVTMVLGFVMGFLRSITTTPVGGK